MLYPPKKTLQKCKVCKVCNPAKAYSIAPFPYPSNRSIPFSYYTCHAQANAQKRYSLFFFWKCLPHWNCKSVINYNRLLGKLFCQKRIKKGSKGRWLQLALQVQALRVFKKISTLSGSIFSKKLACPISTT